MTEAADNVELLKSMYKAFANGDVPTVLAAMDDEHRVERGGGQSVQPRAFLRRPRRGRRGCLRPGHERHRGLRDPSGALPR